jgi:uncharacterized phage protein (TIGR02216 family)
VSAAFPWDEALGLALGVLRWRPQDFWRATPRELAAALGALAGRRGPTPPGRGDLDRLMAAFPDDGPDVASGSAPRPCAGPDLPLSRGEKPDGLRP